MRYPAMSVSAAWSVQLEELRDDLIPVGRALDALAPFCIALPVQPPQPLLYLCASGLRGVDLNLQVTLCVTGFSEPLKWADGSTRTFLDGGDELVLTG